VIHLSDEDLIARLKNFEDHFIERKTSGDDKYDWVKTAVAFANSAPVNFPCVLYIGAKNNGEVEEKPVDLDKLQRTFNKEMSFVYPPIPYIPKILNLDGRQCLAVIIPGSAARPHFAGPAYVRVGSETRNASENQYAEMFASRTDKTRKLLEYKGKPVTVVNRQQIHGVVSETAWGGLVQIEDCNAHFLTLKQPPNNTYSFPLNRVDVSYDHEQNRLRIEVIR
jgi:predicted HTH transcriptional regulator